MTRKKVNDNSVDDIKDYMSGLVISKIDATYCCHSIVIFELQEQLLSILKLVERRVFIKVLKEISLDLKKLISLERQSS